MLSRLVIAGLAVAALFLPLPAVSRPPAVGLYQIEDLGTLGGPSSAANALNEAGQVVGRADVADRGWHAFLWDDGRMTDLGTLEGHWSEAADINEKGQIVGDASIRGRDMHDHYASTPFLWESGTGMRELPVPDGGYVEIPCRTFAINDVGQVVGSVYMALGHHYAWVVQTAANDRFGQFAVDAWGAYDINNQGVAAMRGLILKNDGWGLDFVDRAMLCNTRTGRVQRMGALSPRSIDCDTATSVNDQGIAVGYAHTSRQISRAFIWDRRRGMRDLGTLGGEDSAANSLNELGAVVGKARTRAGKQHAFLYRRGRMQDLNALIPPASGWELTTAEDINNAGQIVGTGLLNGVNRAFLLTPVQQQPQVARLPQWDSGWELLSRNGRITVSEPRF